MPRQPPKMKMKLSERGKKWERTISPGESLSSSGDEAPHQFAVPPIGIPSRIRDKTSQLHISSQATAADASATASWIATPLLTSPPSVTLLTKSPSPKAAKATAKTPRAPRQDFVLSEEEEKVMFEWLEATEEVWNAKKAGYHKHDVKQGLWEAQAKVMNKSAEHLIGWFKSVCDMNTRLIEKWKEKTGDRDDDDEIWTERQRFIMASMKFMDRVVCHQLKPVRNVEDIVLEQSGTLVAAEAAAALEAADIDSEGEPRASTSAGPRRRSIKEGEMDKMLQLMQERTEESHAGMEELRKCKEQHPSTARNAFTAYVQDSLNTMSEWSYRNAKDEVYLVLKKYEDGPEEERVKQQQQQQPQFQQQLPHHHMRPLHTVLPVRGLQPASQQKASSVCGTGLQPMPAQWAAVPPWMDAELWQSQNIKCMQAVDPNLYPTSSSSGRMESATQSASVSGVMSRIRFVLEAEDDVNLSAMSFPSLSTS
ncbi:uncharacterized protein LOC117517803 [Thalassophryne amazonica]|uniref:uncharacterized protein LOC117517803 n=1 Tax=Thalassophryne amazonica TaxID=390379 RepID=UPI0014723DDA|nr:uncharacterized protein LOC117517803 [Thalassophryne amazonica]XP_034034849.1 uncharacterized protein LOC117517803 [Thalassophryne amazonica]